MNQPDRFAPRDEALVRMALLDLSKNKKYDQASRDRAYALLRQERGFALGVAARQTPSERPPPRVPPGVLATRPCGRCDKPGRYIGTNRSGGEVWRAYRCDNGHAFDLRPATMDERNTRP